MTVDELRKAYGARSDYHLGQILGVTRQLVYKWRKRGWVPKHHEKAAKARAGN